MEDCFGSGVQSRVATVVGIRQAQREMVEVETKYSPSVCQQYVTDGDVVHIHYTTYPVNGAEKLDTSRPDDKTPPSAGAICLVGMKGIRGRLGWCPTPLVF